MGLLDDTVSQIRSEASAQNNTSLLNQQLSQIRTGAAPSISFTPSREEGLFRTLFKEEIGAVNSIISPYQMRKYQDLMGEDAKRTETMARAFRNAPKGSIKRERMRALMEGRIANGPSVKAEDLTDVLDKTTSQAIGEAIMLGLLISPAVPVKGAPIASSGLNFLKGSGFGKTFLKGGLMAAPVGAALGLAQEGELKDKLPTIAAFTGGSFISGGVLSGVMPPIAKFLKGSVKKVFEKVRPSKTPAKVVIPVVKQFDKQVAVTTEKAVKFKAGTQPAITKASELEKTIHKKYQELDNLILNETQFLAPKAGSARALKEVTGQVIKKKGKDIIRLEKRLRVLEKKKNKALSNSIEGSLKFGDEVFNKDMGRYTINSFIPDEDGRIAALAVDRNGRLVTLMPEDLVTMKKVIRTERLTGQPYANIPDPSEPIIRGKASNIRVGLKSLVRSVETVFNEDMGQFGQQFVKLLDTTIDEIDRLAGSSQIPMNRLIKELGLDKKATALTEKESRNIVDILDAGLKQRATAIDQITIKPINERVTKFVNTFWETTKPLITEANELGLKVRDRATGAKHDIGQAFVHFPHIPKDMEKFRAAAPEIIENMMRRQGMSRKRATAVLNKFVQDIQTNRYAGLEQARTIFVEGFDELKKWGYETNPIVALKDFTNGSSRRIVEARRFGIADQIPTELVTRMGNEGYDGKLASDVWAKYAGDRGVAQTIKDSTLAIRSFQTVSKLALGAITNTTQVVNTMAEFGIRSFYRGFKKYFTNRTAARETAAMAGVFNDTIDRAMANAGADPNLAGNFLRKVGFLKVESFNRVFTVSAAQEWAEKEALPALLKDVNNPKYRRHLELLQVDPNKVIRRGKFTQDELNRLGQRAVKNTQFRSSVLDLPLLWQSPWAKVITQFKSFTFQQGGFIKDVIIREARHGNMYPLMTFLLASQPAGEAVKDIRDVLKGDFEFRKDMGIIERLIDNQMTVGGFGLIGDLFDNMFRRSQGQFWMTTADLIGGPTAGDVTQLLDGISDTVGGRPDALIKFGGRQTPLLALTPQLQKISGAGAWLRVIGDMLANIATK